MLVGQAAYGYCLERNARRRTEEVVAGDLVATAIQELLGDQHSEWTGTATALLTTLEGRRPDLSRLKDWPRQANQLSARLRVLHATLAESGIELSFSSSHKHGKRLSLRLQPPPGSSLSSSSSPPVPYQEDRGDGPGDSGASAPAPGPAALAAAGDAGDEGDDVESRYGRDALA